MLLIIVAQGVSMGCYADSSTARDLPLYPMQNTSLTLKSCANYCYNKVQVFYLFNSNTTSLMLHMTEPKLSAT